MNREIKFRGKRIDTAKWVYGMFYVINNSPLDVKSCGRKQSYYFERILDETDDAEGRGARNLGEVDPNTIGQYIGLKDRNGVDIYESDILLFQPTNSALGWRYSVTYSNRASFVMSRDNGNSMLTFERAALFGSVEVIGNIHDNPELKDGNK